MGLFDFLRGRNPPGKSGAGSSQSGWEKDLTISLNVREQIKPLEDVFVECACELQKRQTVDNEISILQKLIVNYEEARRRCHMLGQDYIKYFDRMWETARATKEDGPSYVTRYQKRLQYIREHYNELKETERQYQEQAEHLEERLISYLQVNAPVLQSDIYKSFGPLVKGDLQDLLYHMWKSGKIEREKSGRSYIVTLK